MKINKFRLPRLSALCAVLLCLVFATVVKASSAGLPRSSPEAQGVSSEAILAFIEAADQKIDTMNSFMLVRHSHVIAEAWWDPYGPDSPHTLYSLSKSFTSTAVGLAIAEGKLSLGDQVIKFFPDETPSNPSENLQKMRVHDLIRMSTGHQTEPRFTNEESWVKTFLHHPVPYKPGTHFLYNTPATYMLSAIIQKATGMTLRDYLRPRLFDPLGFKNPRWLASPQGITVGGYGLDARTEELARFGQLYLQKGEWQGRRLIPASWIEAATSLQTSNGSDPASDWDQGYGYQFWRCRHGVYRGDGAFGQYCIVMPEQDAVVIITSGVRDMQEVLNLVWDTLLPAFEKAPLPRNRAAEERLRKKTTSLRVRPVSGKPATSIASAVSGKRYAFPSNDRQIESIGFEFGQKNAYLLVRSAGQESRIACGNNAWAKGSASFVNGLSAWILGAGQHPVAASGGWTADDTYSVKLCLYETPFYVDMKFRFKDNELQFDSEYNVNFGPTKLPQLLGRIAE